MSVSQSKRWFGMSPASLAAQLRKLADDIEDADRHTGDVDGVAISDWSLSKRPVPCLVGRAAGHPRFPEGENIFSSELFYLDEERGIARTLSRWYRLGNKVGPDFWEPFGLR